MLICSPLLLPFLLLAQDYISLCRHYCSNGLPLILNGVSIYLDSQIYSLSGKSTIWFSEEEEEEEEEESESINLQFQARARRGKAWP